MSWGCRTTLLSCKHTHFLRNPYIEVFINAGTPLHPGHELGDPPSSETPTSIDQANANALLFGRNVSYACADSFSEFSQNKATGADLVLIDPLWARNEGTTHKNFSYAHVELHELVCRRAAVAEKVLVRAPLSLDPPTRPRFGPWNSLHELIAWYADKGVAASFLAQMTDISIGEARPTAWLLCRRLICFFFLGIPNHPTSHYLIMY